MSTEPEKAVTDAAPGGRNSQAVAVGDRVVVAAPVGLGMATGHVSGDRRVDRASVEEILRR